MVSEPMNDEHEVYETDAQFINDWTVWAVLKRAERANLIEHINHIVASDPVHLIGNVIADQVEIDQ